MYMYWPSEVFFTRDEFWTGQNLPLCYYSNEVYVWSNSYHFDSINHAMTRAPAAPTQLTSFSSECISSAWRHPRHSPFYRCLSLWRHRGAQVGTTVSPRDPGRCLPEFFPRANDDPHELRTGFLAASSMIRRISFTGLAETFVRGRNISEINKAWELFEQERD